MSVRNLLVVAGLATTPLLAFGQSGLPPPDGAGRSKPAASATAPHESAFSAYRRYQDVERHDWREANDRVRDLGGHMGHVRGSANGAADSAAQASQAGEKGGDVR